MKLKISGPKNSTVMENLSFKREELNSITIHFKDIKMVDIDCKAKTSSDMERKIKIMIENDIP